MKEKGAFAMYCSSITGSASRFLNYKEVRAAVRRVRARRNWSLIAVGAALHHARRHNTRVRASMIGRTMARIWPTHGSRI